jgi:hypothetical protein
MSDLFAPAPDDAQKLRDRGWSESEIRAYLGTAAPAPAAVADQAAPEADGADAVARFAQPGRTPHSITASLVESELYPVPGSPAYYYSEDPGRQGLYKKGESKAPPKKPKTGPDVAVIAESKPAPVWTLVLPRVPVVTENYVELTDAGEVARQYFTLAAGRDSARAVDLADLRTGDAWTKLPDLVGTGSRTMRDLLVSIVTDQAERVPRMYAVARTGMHVIDGTRVYVYPDGRTYPDGPRVRVIGVSAELAAAAAPPERAATVAELQAALIEITARGWPVLFGLGAGARSFGYSTRPVAGGAGIWGDPGSGKTLSAGIARRLIMSSTAYPPVATAAFSDTITDMECKVAVEADMPVLIDDLALTAESSQVEIADGRAKLEMLFRAAGNQKAMRGRRRKDLTAAEERRLGSIPVATAQQMPRTMQASLYRRSILPRIESGAVDSAWYLSNLDHDGAARVPAWQSLDVPLRTLGDRIIRRLVDLSNEAGAWLDTLTADARALIGPALDKVLTTDIPPELETVIVVACGIVAGLLMLAEVAGLDRGVLLSPVLTPLADVIARQGDVIADRQDTADNLGTAISDVIRAALLSRRAHVRDTDGVICPCVPGQTEQAQGVTKVPGTGDFGHPVEWAGNGAALYYDQATDALKIRGTELHSLCAGSSDQRVKGYSVQTLPGALLRAGASAPSATERPGTFREPVPGIAGKVRVVHLRGSVVWRTGDTAPIAPEPEPEPTITDAAPEVPDATGPESVAEMFPPPATVLYEAFKDDLAAAQSAADLVTMGGEIARDVTAWGLSDAQVSDLRAAWSARMVALTPAAPPAPAPVPAARRPVESRSARPAGVKSKAPATPAGPRATDAVGIDLADGALTGYPHALPAGARTLVDVMEWAAGLDLGAAKVGASWFKHDGIVYVSAEAAAKLGLPKVAPKTDGGKHVKALTAAGWQTGAKGLTDGYASIWRGDGKDRISLRLIVLPYLEAARPESPEFTTMAGDDDATPIAARLARRQNQFGALVDAPMGYTGGSTGMALLKGRRPERLAALDSEGKYLRDADGTMQYRQAPRSVEMTGTAMPLPIMHAAHPDASTRTPDQVCQEEDYQWIRGGEPGTVRLTDAERSAKFGVGLDTMTSFASVLERLIVPLGSYSARDTIDPTAKDAVGFGTADLSGLEVEDDLPHFATPSGQRPTGPGVYALSTLSYAAKQYGWAGQVTDVQVADRAGALFEPWWPPLREAYLTLMARAGVGADLSPEAFLTAYAGHKGAADADTLALLGMVKSLYKAVVGKFRQGPSDSSAEGIERWLSKVVASPWHRPDIRAYVLSAARTTSHYRYRKTYQASGRAPFAISHDRAVYACESASPLELVSGLVTADGKPLSGVIRLGVRPGSMKPEGAADLADLIERTAATRRNPADLVAHYTDGMYVTDAEGTDDE